ncbi:MAG: hypothetical protein QGG23_05660 [Candidatus Bathyarchaeota archaeon]|nr:hypothetical protein [Candidatus Bathyarchaeota archaeon]
MSKPNCAVCGKKLEPNEVRINERGIIRRSALKRYLCLRCRRDDYNQYQLSINELIKKR